MTETEFWNLIAAIDLEALEREDEAAAVKPLQNLLEAKSVSELEAFEELLAQQLHAIDGRIYAENAGEKGGSDDSFLYARCYVVARGQSFYQEVKANPALMPKSMGQGCEYLLSVHWEAWAKLTNREPNEWEYVPTVSYESASNEALW